MKSITDLRIALKRFTRVIGRPKASDVFRFEEELKRNCTLIWSDLYGIYGSIGMVLEHDEFKVLVGSNVARWQPPPARGPRPLQKRDESDVAYAGRVSVWKEIGEYYHYFTMGERILRWYFFEAFDDDFTKQLKSRFRFEHEITLYACLKFMKEMYGEFTVEDILDNLARMDEPWDGNGPIQMVLNKFNEVQKIAKQADAAIDDKTLIAKLLEAIKDVKDFATVAKEIKLQGSKNWKWEEIQIKLSRVDAVLNRSATANQVVYHAMNVVAKSVEKTPKRKKKRAKHSMNVVAKRLEKTPNRTNSQAQHQRF